MKQLRSLLSTRMDSKESKLHRQFETMRRSAALLCEDKGALVTFEASFFEEKQYKEIAPNFFTRLVLDVDLYVNKDDEIEMQEQLRKLIKNHPKLFDYYDVTYSVVRSPCTMSKQYHRKAEICAICKGGMKELTTGRLYQAGDHVTYPAMVKHQPDIIEPSRLLVLFEK